MLAVHYFRSTSIVGCHFQREAECAYIGYCLFVCLFVCNFCQFVRLRISPRGTKQRKRRQILRDGSWASWTWNLPFWGNFAFPEAQNLTNRRAAASIADRRQSPSTDGALAVSGGHWRLSAILALGMCGYRPTTVPEDGRTCLLFGQLNTLYIASYGLVPATQDYKAISLSCTIFEIKRDICRKSPILTYLKFYLASPLG